MSDPKSPCSSVPGAPADTKDIGGEPVVGSKPIHWRKRRRVHAMMWAYLVFAARKLPVQHRDATAWLYLLEWAALGGKPDEVPGPDGRRIG